MALNENLNPVNRMKIIMSFGVSVLYLNAKQLKPFNPLIIETFQDIFENETKTEVYLEQISNYPTISRFYIKDINFIMSGYYDLSEMESLGSKIIALTKNYSKIDFVNINESIIYILPQAKILNAISEEDRAAYYISVIIFYDIKNNLKGAIQFGKDKKCIHKIKGIIFEYKFNNSKIDYEKDREKMNKLDLDNLNKKYNVKAKLNGSWLKEVIIDNEKFWDIDIDIPYWIKPVQKCLPSDCRFRVDLIWLLRSFYCAKNDDERLKYEHLSQEWKLIIKKLQRDEREYKAIMNKIWEKEIGSMQNMLMAGNYLFAISNRNILYAVEKTSGDILWSLDVREFLYEDADNSSIIYAAPPLMLSNNLLLAFSNGKVLKINAVEGKVIAKTDLGVDISNGLIAVQERVIAVSDDADLIVFK